MPNRTDKKSCPLCGKPRAADYAPFCSSGCRNRDLLQWLGDGYRIPGHPADPDAIAAGSSSDGD